VMPALDGDLLERLETPSGDRYELIFEAVRRGHPEAELCRRTGIDPWYMAEIAALARGEDPEEGLERSFKSVDTCAAEFEAETPYYYSGWERRAAHEVRRGHKPSVVILGSGPNRIGQGIEFDYCCVHAAMTVRESGRDAVMINCNPETVSTDYDTSDRLYFEPLTLEDVLGVIELERPEGVIVQFGGQTPLKLAAGLAEAGVPLLGTPVDAIHRAEDRPSFGALLDELGLKSPPYATAETHEEALQVAGDVGYPLLVRPSYVLGGRAMEICYSREGLESYLTRTNGRGGPRRAIFLDRFLENAIEIDVDALCDGHDVEIGAIMQHVEEAGVHSGDSACVIPAMSLGPEMMRHVEEATRAIALGLGVVGLLNVQFAIHGEGEELYVIEANPRASRTVPFVSKAIGVSLAKVACRLMLGERLADIELGIPRSPRHVSVKEAVLPFGRFPRSDALMGPEMRSTGEVMGVAREFPAAFGKAQAAAGAELPSAGTVFISVTDGDKPAATQFAASFHDMGFKVVSTGGTASAIRRMGVPVERIKKLSEGSPNVVERIEAGEVDLVINTPTGSGARADGYEIRRTAVGRGIPCITTLTGATAALRAIRAIRVGETSVVSLQELHGGLAMPVVDVDAAAGADTEGGAGAEAGRAP
jgi:carbamoyl-phosphate synthase large subunit